MPATPSGSSERPHLRQLPNRRTCDYEASRCVTTSGGLRLRKVLQTASSRLVGHRLRLRLYHDRLDVLVGGTPSMIPQRGRPRPVGRDQSVVSYHYVIYALRRKLIVLLGPVYRDQLFPCEAYRRAFEALLAAGLERDACRIIVALLALAHDRSREADLAVCLANGLQPGRLPVIADLRTRFAPDPPRRCPTSPSRWCR